MTRKHFEAIASSLRMVKPVDVTQLAQWESCIRATASAVAPFNSNFDRGRFLAACGLED